MLQFVLTVVLVHVFSVPILYSVSIKCTLGYQVMDVTVSIK